MPVNGYYNEWVSGKQCPPHHVTGNGVRCWRLSKAPRVFISAHVSVRQVTAARHPWPRPPRRCGPVPSGRRLQRQEPPRGRWLTPAPGQVCWAAAHRPPVRPTGRHGCRKMRPARLDGPGRSAVSGWTMVKRTANWLIGRGPYQPLADGPQMTNCLPLI